MTSFGSARGHSLGMGPPDLLRDQGFFGYFPSNLFIRSSTEPTFADRGGAQCRVPARAGDGLGQLMAWYSVCVFHIVSTIAAILRAKVSLARFGRVPSSSRCW